MTDWPRLTERALVERLGLGDDEVRALVAEFIGSLPRPAYDEAFFQHGIGYPWARPETSYRLDGIEVTPLQDGASIAAAYDDLVATDGDAGPRYPLLAIGSNAAPSTLVRKFAGHEDHQRRFLAVTGYLEGFDIGPLPAVAMYGAVPATLFASPGTQVRVTILWVTAHQLTVLTWTELSYMFGRLSPLAFEPDHPSPRAPALDHGYVYVSRWGNVALDGAPVALAALPARGRTARAMSQEELLDLAATRVLGPGRVARDLVERLTVEPAVLREAGESLAELAVPFQAGTWTEMPTA